MLYHHVYTYTYNTAEHYSLPAPLHMENAVIVPTKPQCINELNKDPSEGGGM